MGQETHTSPEKNERTHELGIWRGASGTEHYAYFIEPTAGSPYIRLVKVGGSSPDEKIEFPMGTTVGTAQSALQQRGYSATV